MVLSAIVSCTSKQTAHQHDNNPPYDSGHKVVTIPLNSGIKWKADEATKKNVAAMVQVVNDNKYAEAGKRKELYTNLKEKIDTLVKECSMKGAEHDALHLWLGKVIKDLKELKEEGNEYSKAYPALKTDIANFYESFE